MRADRSALVRCALSAILLLAGGAIAAENTKQKTFAAPEDAVKALIAALQTGKTQATQAVLGPGSAEIVQSGDAVSDKASRERFLSAYAEANTIERSGDSKAVLVVGRDSWPFPVPLVKGAAGWRFDAKQGREEILNRRIGRNELSTVQAVLAYVDAQREYYWRNPQGGKLIQYAQRFVSTPGKRDGLYFPTKAGEQPSPLGPLFSGAKAEGYSKSGGERPVAYHGYRYRIITGQGESAAGGAYDYLAQGSMIGGFALIAWPASYGNSGVMTFMVNHHGAVYEKDLGPDTATAVRTIRRFDPDKSWKRH